MDMIIKSHTSALRIIFFKYLDINDANIIVNIYYAIEIYFDFKRVLSYQQFR